ncbi:hypothetical protein [Streptomyces alanosinicus]|uniref:Uncharacterized protein n=1 Tax=Streptomyces alanosinicus TaxID=68171 RepID=A0A919CZU5_9ACTN|nr:hypothetical protein [Streptomyces alanosinicus]GHD98179.1 hypothetical protein GCM10010339_04320 [Streptomyces alanosinicus]
MVEQQQNDADQAQEVWRRRAGSVSFLVGLFAALAFFAFFPGLPHVIDWGAVLAALAVGWLARRSCLALMARTGRKGSESP